MIKYPNKTIVGLIHKQKPYLDNQSYRIEKAGFYEKNLINVPCSSNLSEDEVEVVVEKLAQQKNQTP